MHPLIKAMNDQSLACVLNGTQWISPAEVDAKLIADVASGESFVRTWIAKREVICLEFEGRQVLPRYQFDADLNPYPVIKDILAAFAHYTPIRIAAWFESTTNYLDAMCPREVVATNPMAVLKAAKLHAEGPMHG